MVGKETKEYRGAQSDDVDPTPESVKKLREKVARKEREDPYPEVNPYEDNPPGEVT